MTLQPMPAQTRADHATMALRQVILSGAMAPGTQLREIHLSQKLAISRGPLREALQRLEEEGLVQRHPFRGSYVADMSVETLTQIEELRRVLEPYAAVAGLESLRSGPARQALVDAVADLERAAQAQDAHGVIEAHMAIHRSIYAAADNQVLLDIWLSWQNQMRLFLALDHRRLGDLTEVAAAHRRLLEAIDSGDPEIVRRELEEHIQPDTVAQDFADRDGIADTDGSHDHDEKGEQE